MKIPRITDDRVQEQALPNVRFDAEAGDFGQKNIQAYEKGLTGMAAVAEDIYLKQQKEADEAVQMEAGTLAAQKEMEWNNKVRNTRGRAAGALDGQFDSDWEKFRGDVSKNLVKSPKQQQMVDRIMSTNYYQLKNKISSHMATEADQYYTDQAKAMITADRATAIDSMDPMRIADSIGKQKAIITQEANRKGISFEAYQGQLTDVEKETKMEYVQRLADVDPDQARAVVEEEKSLFGAEVSQKMNNYILRAEKIKRYESMNAQIDNDISFLGEWADGKQVDMKGASPDLAKAIVAYQTDPDLILLEDTPAYTAYAEKIIDTGDKAKINRLLIDAVTGGADGRPNMKEIESLVKISRIRAQGLTITEFEAKRDAEKKVSQPKKKSFVDNVFETVRSWAEKYGENELRQSQIKSGLYKEAVNAVAEKEPKTAEEAQKIAAKVIEKGQAQINPNRTKYQKDQVYDFPAGRGLCIGYRDDGTPLFKKVK